MGRSEGRTWTKGDAEEFYGEHKGKAFFEGLVDFMTGGPVVQLCLEKVCACSSRCSPINSLPKSSPYLVWSQDRQAVWSQDRLAVWSQDRQAGPNNSGVEYLMESNK